MLYYFAVNSRKNEENFVKCIPSSRTLNTELALTQVNTMPLELDKLLTVLFTKLDTEATHLIGFRTN